jgi:hypothetical protein
MAAVDGRRPVLRCPSQWKWGFGIVERGAMRTPARHAGCWAANHAAIPSNNQRWER